MFASWFWGEYFNTDSFNDADNPRLLAVKKRPGSAHVPPDYPPKKHTAAPPGHLPKKLFINPNSSPKKPYTTKNEAPKKRANVVPEKTNMLPKKHARKNEHLPRKNKNVFPEKTACLSEKTCPWSKSTISRPKRFFGAFFRVARKNQQRFFGASPVFPGDPEKHKKHFFGVFPGGPKKHKNHPKHFFGQFSGSFRGPYLALGKMVFGCFFGHACLFFRARVRFFGARACFFGAAGLIGPTPFWVQGVLGRRIFGTLQAGGVLAPQVWRLQNA